MFQRDHKKETGRSQLTEDLSRQTTEYLYRWAIDSQIIKILLKQRKERGVEMAGYIIEVTHRIELLAESDEEARLRAIKESCLLQEYEAKITHKGCRTMEEFNDENPEIKKPVG